MPYATYEEVILRYPLLSTFGNDPEVDVSSDLIYYAEIELNGALSTHYTVPFSAAYPTIKDLTIDLAYYRSIRYTDPERAQEIHEAVMGRIEGLKNGDEYIYTGSGTLEPAADDSAQEPVWSNTGGYHPIHSTLDAENPYTHIDSSLQYDEEQQRR